MSSEVIECQAAVAWKPGTPLSIETILVAPPKENEVRIRIFATGVCHTDAYALSGKDPEGVFPVILGHEGAGIVESVGTNVTTVSVGDHVVPCYIPQCYDCKFCSSQATNLCSRIRETQGKGLMPDGTTRFTCRGSPIYHFMGTSCFSEYTVVPEISVAKIDKDADLSKVGLLGCGVATGIGAALNTAKVNKEATCAIWGMGCVGLATAMGCRMAGAKQIIGIDIDPKKLKLAESIGCTQVINSSELKADESTKARVIESTDGGCDFAFECVGNVELMNEALESTHKGWGTCVIAGVAPSGAQISTRPFQLITGRTWKGTAFGGWKSRDQVPELVRKAMAGEIDLDFFISNSVPLDCINQAFTDMHDGKSIRTMIVHKTN